MGGKTGTTTSSMSIPPEVLARYNSVNATADKAASQTFQPYSSNPSDFVAQLNTQQNNAIGGINNYANYAQSGYNQGFGSANAAENMIQSGSSVAQPYFTQAQGAGQSALGQYGQASGLASAAMTPLQQATYAAQPAYQQAMAGTAGVAAGYNAPNYQAGVQGYLNPYLQNAVGATAAQLQNINQQQQQQLMGNAVSQGAFGGDRTNIGMSNLMNQQNLATGATLSGMENQGYQAAAQNYMSGLQQQGALANQYGQLGGQAQQALINAGLAQGQGAANIANIANQQMSGATQYGNLGTAAQNAALQGVGLEQANAALYGNLGAGAQTAGLQGAQAQLGAGTLGQQTEQAGKTAMYNQYLQGQAYPFQIAQFLAQIAGITGPNSGSTTTTTQPMSWFSDRRLKEDIKQVGKAENGLPIYKFKYKGDPKEQTHIGFMADEVEKIHPEAVGESHGFKTVDYDRAARAQGGLVGPQHEGMGFGEGGREHHAYGSAVGSEYDPNNIQNILSRHQAMYANIDTHPVPMARILSGGVGKHSRVPEASLQPAQLRTPGATPRLPDSELSQGVDYATKLASFDKAIDPEGKGKGLAWVQSIFANQKQKEDADAGLTNSSQAPVPNVRGGLVGYATGGDAKPYSVDDPMSDLIEQGQKDLVMQKLGQKGPATLPGAMKDPTVSDTMDAAKTAAMIAKMFAAKGGRIGYATDGTVEPDDVLTKYGPVIGHIESNNKYDALGPVTKSGDRGYGKYQVMGANVPSWTEEALGKKMSPEELLADTGAQDKVFSHHFGKALNKYGTPQDAASVWFSGRPQAQAGNAQDINQTTVPKYISKFNAGLGAADMPAPNAAPASALTQGENAPAFPRTGPSKPTQQQGGLGDLFKTENVIPVLTGLGAMASSRSPYLGAAILEGLGAGAGSYLGTQKSLAGIEQTKAETDAVRANTFRLSFQQTPAGNFYWVKGANGQITPMKVFDYNKIPDGQKPQLAFQPPNGSQIIQSMYGGTSASPEATSSATGAPKTNVGSPAKEPTAQQEFGKIPTDFNFDENSHSSAAKDSDALDPMVGGPGVQAAWNESNKYRQNIMSQAAASREEASALREMSSNLANAVGLEKFGTTGFGFNQRADVTNMLNTAARMVGHPEWQVQGGETQSAISDKVSAIQGALRAHNASQNSLAAFNTLTSLQPNPNMSKESYSDLTAMMLTQNMRAADADSHLKQWGETSNNSFVNAGRDFERKTAQRYVDEQNALSDLMAHRPKQFTQMMNGRTSNGERLTPEQIEDALQQAYHIKGLSRYFVRGV
jgi:hypothetical protein